ncbi:dTDP-4-dehydrorhamnose reductase [Bacteroidetes/Chlorobi group bacterium MS-B_bin-24]|nr:MAG: dTDP-4-dehydrorhamnose reductase [Bacteroidetes/Chlorobi group bacterium MS-B_bin-24]
MKFLLIGRLGQLGNEFKHYFQKNNIEFYETDLPTLDVFNLDDVLEIFSNIKPEIVINCSAYNFVDRAEEDRWNPIKVNTIGVKNLAYACEKYDSFLVHFSTDYVFDGEKPTQYTEEDEPNPINFYGLSKYLGEQAISDILDSYLIFRVSWLYGYGTQNFIVKFLHWVEDTDIVRIAIDEVSVPTSTFTVVDAVMKSLDEGLCGLYHLTNSGFASRYEWALEIKKNLGLRINIVPVNSEEFHLPARRPKFSAMSNQKISSDLNIEIPSWREELERFLNCCK